jgi:putative hemolysin
MPNFLIRYLKKTIHEDELNLAMAETKGMNGYEFSLDTLKRLDIKVEVEGLENVPAEGRVIFTVNHPLGGMDAIAIIKEVYPMRNDLRFVKRFE